MIFPHIFNRFYQTKKNKTAEGGTGIGLALSKEFVQLLNGTLDVKSELGQGTIFTLKIPRIEVISQVDTQTVEEVQSLKEVSQPITPTTIQPTEDFTPTNEHRPTILLVEDNHDLRAFVESLLSEKYQVLTAENGKEALRQLTPDSYRDGSKQLAVSSGALPTASEVTANQPAKTRQAGCQLIISDVMMPVMDGYQLLAELKSNDKYRHIPVIMLTARGGLDDKLKALRIGVDDICSSRSTKRNCLLVLTIC